MKKLLLFVVTFFFLAPSFTNSIDDITKHLAQAQDIHDIEKPLFDNFENIVIEYFQKSQTLEQNNIIQASLKKLTAVIHKKANQTQDAWGTVLALALDFYPHQTPEQLGIPNWKIKAQFEKILKYKFSDRGEFEQARHNITCALSICSHLKEIRSIAQPLFILPHLRHRDRQKLIRNSKPGSPVLYLYNQYSQLRKSTKKEPLLDKQLLTYADNQGQIKIDIFIRPIQNGHTYKLKGFIELKKEIAAKIITYMQYLTGINVEELPTLEEENRAAQTDEDCNILISEIKTILDERPRSPQGVHQLANEFKILSLSGKTTKMLDHFDSTRVLTEEMLSKYDEAGRSMMYYIAKKANTRKFDERIVKIALDLGSHAIKKLLCSIADSSTQDSYLHVHAKEIALIEQHKFIENFKMVLELIGNQQKVKSLKNIAGKSPLDILPENIRVKLGYC